MKPFFFLLLFAPIAVLGQSKTRQQENQIRLLIAQYEKARESQDSALLKKILLEDIDQLVSNGQWRSGITEAIAGMQTSTRSNPGTRRLEVEKIKFLGKNVALVDCRYTITNPNGTKREMWSSFSVIRKDKIWRIAAIRNMNPSAGS